MVYAQKARLVMKLSSITELFYKTLICLAGLLNYNIITKSTITVIYTFIYTYLFNYLFIYLFLCIYLFIVAKVSINVCQTFNF